MSRARGVSSPFLAYFYASVAGSRWRKRFESARAKSGACATTLGRIPLTCRNLDPPQDWCTHTHTHTHTKRRARAFPIRCYGMAFEPVCLSKHPLRVCLFVSLPLMAFPRGLFSLILYGSLSKTNDLYRRERLLYRISHLTAKAFGLKGRRFMG